jgi:hypothetical protein
MTKLLMNGRKTKLIILPPAGIPYSVEPIGAKCEHPEDFAQELDIMLKNSSYYSEKTLEYVSLEFDWSRLDQLREEWWPIIVTHTPRRFIKDDNTPPKMTKAIVCAGNYD